MSLKLKSAYRIRTEKKLFSFDDPIGEVPILGRKLFDCQRDFLSKAGFVFKGDIDDRSKAEGPAFVFQDDLFFSEGFLREIKLHWKSWIDQSMDLQMALADNDFNRRFALPHSVDSSNRESAITSTLYPAYFVAGNQTPRAPKLTVITQKIFPFQLKVPPQIIKSGWIEYPLCDVWLTRMASPFHLMQCNLAANMNRAYKSRASLPGFLEGSLGKIGSKAFTWGLKRLNRIGKNCHIHPTAVLEGAEIGDNVTIGAHSVIRLSKIMDHCTLEDQSCVRYSVLGEASYIAQGNHLHLSMTYPEAFLIHGPYQFSIFGRRTAVMAVINCDIRLDQKTIKIQTDSGLLDSNQELLGIAYGHESKIGGGNVIAPGRIVPNGYLRPPPDFIITDF